MEKIEKEGTEKKGRGSGKHICGRGSTRCLDWLLAVFTQDSHSEAACFPGDDYAEHLAAKSWEVKTEKASWDQQTHLHIFGSVSHCSVCLLVFWDAVSLYSSGCSGTQYVVQADFKLTVILLHPSPKSWNDRCDPPCPANIFLLFWLCFKGFKDSVCGRQHSPHLCVCEFMCVSFECGQVPVHESVHAQGSQSTASAVIPQLLTTLVLRQRLPLAWDSLCRLG